MMSLAKASNTGFFRLDLIRSFYLRASLWITSSVGVTKKSQILLITLLLISPGNKSCCLCRDASYIIMSFLLTTPAAYRGVKC